MFKGFNRLLGSFFVMTLAYVMPFAKIWGAWCSHFSWSSIAAPVASLHFGIASLIAIMFGKSLFSLSSWGLFFLLKRLPLVISSWAFSSKNWITSFIIPAVCMVLFISHATGSQVFYYSFYWLIPMALYFAPVSIYTRSLSATFVAHAVGSVVWLYFRSIGVEVWQLLVPMVIVERLLMAAGMVAIHFVLSGAKELYKQGITRIKVSRKAL